MQHVYVANTQKTSARRLVYTAVFLKTHSQTGARRNRTSRTTWLMSTHSKYTGGLTETKEHLRQALQKLWPSSQTAQGLLELRQSTVRN